MMNCSSTSSKQGSALVVTILVTSLLLVLVLAFSAQVRLELRSVANSQSIAQARANARLALELGITRLQENAGPDTRVTATAGGPGDSGQTQWTGVWDSAGGDPVWLVSGNAVPTSPLPPAASVKLVSATPRHAEVRAPLVPMGPGPERLGWWVGDEGVKARVDLAGVPTPADSGARLTLSRSAQAPDLPSLGGAWASDINRTRFGASDVSFRRRLADRGSLEQAADGLGIPDVFHDLTVYGEGLPVNVVEGGVKSDLSILLDQSSLDHPMQARSLGASPTLSGSFPAVANPGVFFLSDRIGTGSAIRSGPNMGILWNYGRLWRDVTNNQIELLLPRPVLETDVRTENWFPYTSSGTKAFERDRQHVNSPVMPVLSHLQISLRLRSKLDPDGGVDPVSGNPLYIVQLEIKPVVGLWNPYNVVIGRDYYVVDYLLAPMLKLGIRPPGAVAGTFGAEYETTSWLRLLWHSNRPEIPTPEQPQGGKWVSLFTSMGPAFQPGEVRMFSVDELLEAVDGKVQQMNLRSRYHSTGAFVANLESQTSMANRQVLKVPGGTELWFHDVYMQDSHHPEFPTMFPTINPVATPAWVSLKTGSLGLSRFTGIWNGGDIQQRAAAGDRTVPERILGNVNNRDPVRVEDLISGNHHIGTWSFHLRTTTQMETPEQRIRGWVDTDPRALVGNRKWDGLRASADSTDGWDLLSPWMGGSLNNPSVSDGFGGNRGLLAVGGVGNPAPQTDGSTQYRGYLGASNTPTGGVTHLPVFDVPTSPIVSLGQFQHAKFSRYSFEPGFAFGNSYANPRIPLDRTQVDNFNGETGLTLHDLSYELNRRLWDRYFLSTLAPEYAGGGNSIDTAFAGRLNRLPNPRMLYRPLDGDTTPDALIANAGDRAAEALASRIRVQGAFNVNSLSKTAWKALLSSMVNAELPVVDPLTRILSWESPAGIRFSRFGHVLSPQAYNRGEPGHEGFWQGWRNLSAAELDALAEEIVQEVKARGPFRSMADFVNRTPASPTLAHQRKGALQAALDRTVNRQGTDLPVDLGGRANRPLGTAFSDAFDGESESAGAAGYLLQGDLLQALAPVLTVRSDTFVVRGYAETPGPGGASLRAWCEALVQRDAEFLNPADPAWAQPVEDTLQAVNQRFGRRFKVLSFRWLNEEDL
jgi:hypothetical protein